MDTKPLLYGLAGFFIGGLLVAIAATTFDKPSEKTTISNNSQSNELTMSEMTDSLRNKTGNDYDMAFISHMIDHHQAAVDMAKLSAQNAKHDEIKQLSNEIVNAQEKEINEMKQWQKDWGYSAERNTEHSGH